MKKIILLFLILFINNSYSQNLSDSVKIYISTLGNDRLSGTKPTTVYDTKDGPFRTFEKARDYIRELKKKKSIKSTTPVCVFVRGGIYNLKNEFELTAQDSGSANFPIGYSSYCNEKVYICSYQRLKNQRPIKSTELIEIIEIGIRNSIIVYDLSDFDLSTENTPKSKTNKRVGVPLGLDLFYCGKRLSCARKPTIDLSKISYSKNVGKDYLGFEELRPSAWKMYDDIWAYGYFGNAWTEFYQRIKGMDTLTNPNSEKNNQRLVYFNTPEELDSSGEWYFDKSKNLIYLIPPANFLKDSLFAVFSDYPLLELQNTSNINFRNINFLFSCSDAIIISNSKHIDITGCRIGRCGSSAIHANNVTHCTISDCEIYQTGHAGIVMDGGDKRTLLRSENSITNCDIHQFSEIVRVGSPGILVSGVGCNILNNKIYNAPNSAIWLKGNENMIAKNEIYSVVKESADAGAIYMGNDWTERGNKIINNYIHDLGSEKSNAPKAIYFDDFASGTLVSGNIFKNVFYGVYIGGGRDNIIENNFFINTKNSIGIDARGKSWEKNSFIEKNKKLKTNLDALKYMTPPYSIKYPELVTLYSDQPEVPKGNKVLNNFSYSCKQWVNLPDGLIKEDILIQENNQINLKQSDFKLEKGVLFSTKIPNQKISFSSIGLKSEIQKRERTGVNELFSK